MKKIEFIKHHGKVHPVKTPDMNKMVKTAVGVVLAGAALGAALNAIKK